MKKNNTQSKSIQSVLEEAVVHAKGKKTGKVACYIPELAIANPELTAMSLMTLDGQQYVAGDVADDFLITLQSAAKLVVLIGLLDTYGAEKVFTWTRTDPSEADFSSISRLDQFGPLPSNPMINSGAISLSSHIPGNFEQQISWLEEWMEKLFGMRLNVNQKVFASERRTGDKNRALAYLMKSTGVIKGDVDAILEMYFYLCSFETTVKQASYLPMLLANAGLAPSGIRIISLDTVRQVVAIMATCGLYNQSGSHLVKTGLPAKSGVSGFILASALGQAGIAAFSPRVNRKGTSVRGEFMLEYVSKNLNWHFAA